MPTSLTLSHTDATLGGRDSPMATGLYCADRQQIEACPLNKHVLGEGEEGPSIGEGRVRVEGERIKRPPLVC